MALVTKKQLNVFDRLSLCFGGAQKLVFGGATAGIVFRGYEGPIAYGVVAAAVAVASYGLYQMAIAHFSPSQPDGPPTKKGNHLTL